MNQEKIIYRDIMKLGFVRDNESDPVFRDENGFDWFTVILVLCTYVTVPIVINDNDLHIIELRLEWDCISHTIELVRYNNREGNVLSRIAIKGLKEVKMLIKFYEKQSE